MTYTYEAAVAAGRNRNRVYEKVVNAVVSACRNKGMTQKDLADRLGRKPAQLSKWLSGPSNWTLDTVSDLLFSIDSEMDYGVVFDSDRHKSNQFNGDISIPLTQIDYISNGRGAPRQPSATGTAKVLTFTTKMAA